MARGLDRLAIQSAEFLHPDVRKKLLRAAERENKTTRDRLASQATVDEIMETHPEDRGKALEAARKTKDPDVRVLNVAAVNQRFNESNVIEAEELREIRETAFETIANDGHVSDIPSRELSRLTNADRTALRAYEDYVMNGEEPIHSDDKYYEWTLLSINEQGGEDLRKWRPYFDDPHYERAVARQQAIRDAQEGGKDGHTKMVTRDELINKAVQDALFDGLAPTRGKKAKLKRYNDLRFQIQQAIDQAEERGPLSRDDVVKLIDAVTLPVLIDKAWASDPLKLRIEVQPGEKFYVPYDDIPPLLRAELEDVAAGYGNKASKSQLVDAYAAYLQGKSNADIESILSR